MFEHHQSTLGHMIQYGYNVPFVFLPYFTLAALPKRYAVPCATKSASGAAMSDATPIS